MHLILTGATGLVGSAVLHEMIKRETVSRVSVLSRRPVPQAEGHEKVNVIIHKDFNQYPPEVIEKLKGADGVVWALGISQTEVTKEKYEEITYDYSIAAAKAFASLNNPFKFVWVSGEGATDQPGMLTPLFGKVKGKTEQEILKLSQTPECSSLRPFLVRPAAVDPSSNPEVLPYIAAGQLTAVKRATRAAVRGLYSSAHSPTEMLAKVFVDLAMGDGKELQGDGITHQGRIINNKAIRMIAGL